MAGNPTGRATDHQKLGGMIDWFIMDRGISIEFSYNAKHNGKVIPEYDIWYFQNGRRVTERGVAMQAMTEFMARNYKWSIAQIIAALTARTWEHYINNFQPAEWITAMAKPVPEKRPPGRPRKFIRVAIPEPDDEDYAEQVVTAP